MDCNLRKWLDRAQARATHTAKAKRLTLETIMPSTKSGFLRDDDSSNDDEAMCLSDEIEMEPEDYGEDGHNQVPQEEEQ